MKFISTFALIIGINFSFATTVTSADYEQRFEGETIGEAMKSFSPMVGNWEIRQEEKNKVFVVNGKKWKEGQPSSGIAEKAKGLFGERYAEFLDSIKAYAYFPLAVNNTVSDFQNGIIIVRFKGIDGRIDQAAGIVFNLKENGDYLTIRANPLENNLVLWKYIKGKRSSEKWIRNVPTPSKQWHSLKVEISGAHIKGFLNDKLYLEHDWKEPIRGKVGLWSKADSLVYFDDYQVQHKK